MTKTDSENDTVLCSCGFRQSKYNPHEHNFADYKEKIDHFKKIEKTAEQRGFEKGRASVIDILLPNAIFVEDELSKREWVEIDWKAWEKATTNKEAAARREVK